MVRGLINHNNARAASIISARAVIVSSLQNGLSITAKTIFTDSQSQEAFGRI
jgi:hypothetical protein